MRVAQRWMRAAAGGLAATMLFAACGDDESAAPAQTTVAPTSTTLSQAQLDEQKAQRIVLTAADLPGYTQDPPDPDDAGSAGSDDCLNNPVFNQLGEDDDPRGASSPNFSKSDTVTVSSDVTFADTEEMAVGALAFVGAASFQTCFSKALATEIRKDRTITNVTVTAAKLPALTLADQSVGYRVTAKFRVSGTAVTVFQDYTFIRAGRAVAALSLTSATTAFPAAERSRLATVMAGRMVAP